MQSASLRRLSRRPLRIVFFATFVALLAVLLGSSVQAHADETDAANVAQQQLAEEVLSVEQEQSVIDDASALQGDAEDALTASESDSALQAQASDDSIQVMYRLYNPNSGEHFYTASIFEHDHLVSVGWNDEGEGWKAPSAGDAVYRLYNSFAGEHHYTLDAGERDVLVSVGWNDEGIGWYSDPSHSVPLFRLYNPNEYANNHHYTTDAGERDILLSIGWRDEGISWHGVNPSAGGSANSGNGSNGSSGSGSSNGGSGNSGNTGNPGSNPGDATTIYTVTFDGNGGTMTGAVKRSVKKGSPLGDGPSVSRPGYDFTGWFVSPNGGNQYTASTLVNSDVKLFAGWKIKVTNPNEKSTYRVQFNANGGSGSMSPISYYRDTTYSLPRNLYTRSGHAFDGWATEQGGAKRFSDCQQVSNLGLGGSTITLYARWKIKTGETKIGSNTYYVQSDGSYYKGWKQVGSNWKYYDPSTGARVNNKEKSISKSGTSGPASVSGYRFFDVNGNLLYGWQGVPDGKGNYIGKYFDINTGKRYQGGEYKITMNNKTEKDPAPGWVNFDNNGCILYGWQGVGNNVKYYDISNGKRYQSGEFYISMNNKTEKDPNPGYCFFDGSGCLLYGWQGVPDGKGNYIGKYFDTSNGKRYQGGEFYVGMNDKTTPDPNPGWVNFDNNGCILYGWHGVLAGNDNYVTKYYNPANGKRVHGMFYVSKVDKNNPEPKPGYRYFDKNDGHICVNTWKEGYYYDAIGLRQSNASSTSYSTSYDQSYARQIFDAYNAYRTSCGLGTVTWDNTAYNYAMQSAKHNGDALSLVHVANGYGRVDGKQISDILQYATWRMDPAEAVTRWKNSDGHRKMMKCPTAQKGAVAVYKNAQGYYYFVIVYNFTGSNQSKS